MNRPCLDCPAYTAKGPRCPTCEAKRQRARNERRKPLYGGSWYATSRRMRKAQPWCSICGSTEALTVDHEHGRVECRECNSRHRKDVS